VKVKTALWDLADRTTLAGLPKEQVGNGPLPERLLPETKQARLIVPT
jgi:hypothetical protein